jgi:excinuclease ABC subunit C
LTDRLIGRTLDTARQHTARARRHGRGRPAAPDPASGRFAPAFRCEVAVKNQGSQVRRIITPAVPDDIPSSPGVYVFKNRGGKIVYIGKADSLRSRVRSYFGSTPADNPWTRRLVRAIGAVEYIVTPSPVDALILEANLIKQHKPRYNINLKDDKKYPYLKLTMSHPYPRLILTRTFRRDGSVYFGPYTRVKALRHTLRLLKKIFPLRQCTESRFGAANRPCLNYEMGRCLGPCTRPEMEDQYGTVVKAAREFLEGKAARVVETLQTRMEKLAEELRFEEAATVRDQLRAMEAVAERQTVVFGDTRDRDFVATASEKSDACGVVLEVREGKLLGRQTCALAHATDHDPGSLLSGFITQYYLSATYVPSEVCVSQQPEGSGAIEAWLTKKKGARVRLRCPASGKSRELIELAVRNARLALEDLKLRKSAWTKRMPSSIHELKELLHLVEAPRRIEAFDVSSIRGKDAVGSMVVMIDGAPRRSEYRRFRIKRAKAVDDYAMMREIVSRRLAREGEWKLPQLMLIDGGAGHASAAARACAQAGVEVRVFGLAKRLDELFEPGGQRALMIPHTSPALNLLKLMRDEAHRFAVTYHRTLRGKRVKRSSLEQIPGVGPVKARALLDRFGGLEGVQSASASELETTPGIGPVLAAKVRDYIRREMT